MAKIKHKWTAKCKRFDHSTGSESTVEEEVQIQEEEGSIDMGKGKAPFGRPILADDAIHLMRRFWDRINALLGVNWIEPTSNPEDENEATAVDTVKVLIEMLKTSFGMTHDKNMILKILSQPACEGIRFYLAEKQKGKDFLTLVLVGVDAEGNDLHYKGASLEGADKQLKQTSATSEYGHPPYTFKELIDNRFYLLKLAQALPKP